MIKINEQFSIDSDAYNWILHQWTQGKDKDGNVKMRSKKTFYPTVGILLQAVIDKSLKDCESLTEIKEVLILLGETLEKFKKVTK